MRRGELMVLAAITGAAAAAVLARKASEAASSALEAVSPTNPDNVFYGGVNALGRALSGDPAWTLGGWLYDVTHPSSGLETPVARRRTLSGAPADSSTIDLLED